MTSYIEYQCNNCGHEGLNTRAVPDVPELVRYDLVLLKIGKHRTERTRRIRLVPDGDYVRYDQAAEVIAAKDEEIQELKENLGVANTERQADAEYIGHLQAELAQIKAQEPVGIFTKSDISQYIQLRSGDATTNPIPLYAAPVDQTAEIESFKRGMLEELDAKIDAEFKVVELKAEIERLRSATTHRMD